MVAMQSAKRPKRYLAGLGTPSGMCLFGVPALHLSPLIIILQPPLAGGMGGYNHHCIGGEVERRPLLLYAYPLGHRVLASLKIPGTCENQHTEHSTRCDAQCARCTRLPLWPDCLDRCSKQAGRPPPHVVVSVWDGQGHLRYPVFAVEPCAMPYKTFHFLFCSRTNFFMAKRYIAHCGTHASHLLWSFLVWPLVLLG